jgi:hypothetical protein
MISKPRLRFKNSLPAKALKILFFILLAMYSFAVEAATVTWDGGANDGLWGSPTNWDGNILPTSADDVVIGNGDVVTLSSGTGQALSVKLENGSDLVISPSGTLNADRITGVFCTDCDLTNSGTINIQGSGSGTGIRIYGSLINNNGATISISGKSSGFSVPTAVSTFDNYGIINFTGAGATASGINADQFNNYGSGVVSLANIGGIGVSAENFDNDGSLTISGTGDGINSDELNNSGTLDLTVGNSADAILAFNFYNSGTIGGNGIYTFNNTQSLGGVFAPGNSPGTMTFQGNQNFLVSNTMQMEVNGTTPNTEHDQIIVNGTATISGTLDATINYTPSNNDRIVIISATAISGTFSSISPALPFDWSIDYSVAGEVALVYSYTPGKWDGAAGDGQWTTANNWEGRTLPGAADDVVINNGDAVTLSSGTVTVNTITLSSGSDLSISSGATLDVNKSSGTGRAIHLNGSGVVLTNAGDLNVSGGGREIDLDGGTLINLSGGTIDLSTSSYGIDANGGTIDNSGTITKATGSQGIYAWNGGFINNNSGGTLTFNNSSSKGINLEDAGLTNNGTINISGGSGLGIDFRNDADFGWSNAGTINISNTGSTGIIIGDADPDNLNNTGSITITNSGADGVLLSNNYGLNSSGNVTISGSTGKAINSVTAAVTNTGTLKGTGTFDTNNSLAGTVSPGTSPGTMTFPADQTLSGTLEIEVDGTTPNTEHDQIIVNGTATISGTLDATINYTPTGQDRIVIISATAISGTFSTINPALPANWIVDYSVAGEVALVYDYQDGLWDGDAGDGLWTTAANWDGNILPSSTADIVINNGDAVTLPSGTIDVKSISLTNSSDLTIDPGVNITISNFSSRGIDIPCGDCTFTNSGILTITGKSVGMYSESPINSDGVIIISNCFNSGIFSYSNFTNSGLINLTGPFSNKGIYLEGGATNNASGSISLSNAGQGGIEHFGPPFTNLGSISVSGGTTGFQTSDLVNSGTINVSGASNLALNIGSSIDNASGTLIGGGNFRLGGPSNSLDLDGIVDPGPGIGTMTFTDDQTFTASGTIKMTIGNTTTHDQIIVNGTATIGGALDATILYTSPANGDRIEIITATAISGTFSSINPALPNDWKIEYSATKVELVYEYIQGKWDGEAGDGLWTSADNWEGGILPTSSDNVIIDNGDAVTLPSGTVTVHTVSISNSSDLTVSSGATLNVNNSGFGNTVDIDGLSCDVIVGGTVNITGGSNGIDLNDADWTTQSGGQTNISAYSSYGYYDNSSGRLTNAGTMTVDGGARGIRLTGGQLNNNSGGTLTVQNTSSGGIFVPVSGTVSNSGNMNINSCGGISLSATSISNSGSGNISITNASTGIYPTSDFFNSATITINGATGIGLDLDGSSYENSGTITISGTTGNALIYIPSGFTTFSNTGTLKGTGTFNTANNALGGTIIPGTSTGTMAFATNQTFSSTTMEFEINGTTAGTQHDQITVTGTATISGTLNTTIGYTPSNGDRIEIITATAISGTFSTVTLPNDWKIEYSATKVELVYEYIQGKWDGEAGDGLWTSADNWEGGILPTSSDNVIIDNGDAVTLPSGTVTVHKVSISNSSDLTVSSGATLNVNNSGFGNTVDVDGLSCDVIVGGTVNITGGSNGIDLNDADWTTQSGGQTNISAYSSYGYYDNSSGRLTNAGTMTVDGGAGGIRLTGGTLSNNSGGTLTVQNTSSAGIYVPVSGTVSNSGNININSCGGISLSASDISNSGSGNISITNAGTGIYPTSDFFNSATITINGATGIGLELDGSSYENSGTITISGTTGNALIYIPSGFTTFSNTGTLKGTGTFNTANNALGGTIIPGTSTGIMAFATDQTFSSTTMEFEINGTTAGTQHDQITVTGTATIGGTLNTTIGYTPSNGDRIVIISATTISGTFSSVNLPTDWSIDYSQAGEVALVYSGVSLPVELLSFDGKEQNGKVLLSWQTASEINNSRFEIEWSKDGRTFEKIGEVNGAGTTNEVQFYEFLHRYPVSGINYYRLKQHDFDEEFDYSDIVSIDCNNTDGQVKIYPNPATDFIIIEGLEDEESVQIFDVNGWQVKAFQILSPSGSIPVADLPSGTYFMKAGQVFTKLLIQ